MYAIRSYYEASPAVAAETESDLKASLIQLEARLEESESQARRYAERAGMADDLEARVERLKRELQALRSSNATPFMPVQFPAQDPDAAPAPFFTSYNFV